VTIDGLVCKFICYVKYDRYYIWLYLVIYGYMFGYIWIYLVVGNVSVVLLNVCHFYDMPGI